MLVCHKILSIDEIKILDTLLTLSEMDLKFKLLIYCGSKIVFYLLKNIILNK